MLHGLGAHLKALVSPPQVEKGNRLRMQISGIEWKSTVFEQYQYHIEIVSVVCEKIDIVSRSFQWCVKKTISYRDHFSGV